MATARSLELQALARRIADGLPPEIDEVLLTGSASRGVADDDSDFEMLLVGETLPPPLEIAAGLDVFDVGEMPDRRGWWIGGTAEGESFELIAWSRERTEERVIGIPRGGDCRPHPHPDGRGDRARPSAPHLRPSPRMA